MNAASVRAIPSMPYDAFSQALHDRAGTTRVIKAQMELTYRCNLRCRHCYTDPYNDRAFFPKEMTLAEVIRILDEMADAGIFWLNFTGGEALQRPDFFDIYAHAIARGFLIVLYTNGTTLTESVIERLRQQPPFFIDVSCHAATPESFDWFTQVPGSHRQFLRAMERLRASGLPFRLKSTAMTWNQAEWPELMAYVRGFDVPLKTSAHLAPKLDGDLSPLEMRLPADGASAVEARARAGAEVAEPTAVDEDDCANEAAAAAVIGRPDTPRLYRCGCATNAIHINAWAQLGTCTLEYEVRASLREHSVAEAIDRVFSRVRGLHYTSATPCGACVVHRFCQKAVTPTRQQFETREAPNPFECDAAVARASSAADAPVPHPLAGWKETDRG